MYTLSSEFFAVVPAPKRAAIEETSSDLPIDAETQLSDKTDHPEVAEGDSASGKHKTRYNKHCKKTFSWLEYAEDLGSYVLFSVK